MKYSVTQALQYIEDNDVKFIRLAFCDLCGVQKNISIMPSEMERAFASGISLDASEIDGLGSREEGLFLCPDPSTLAILPWRPMQGRVVRFFCDILHADGTPFCIDSRAILKNTLQKLRAAGLVCRIGAKSEFYLFHLDDQGQPTHNPFDNAGYMDVAPLDRGETIRREICLSLEDMGLRPESSHHEHGPGQNEIDFRYSGALEAADNFITFKWAVKAISARNGAYASFMPRPLMPSPLPDFFGNGMHINITLMQDGKNLFASGGEGEQVAAQFMAGVLAHAPAINAALNSTTNSYRRLLTSGPRRIGWSHSKRGQMLLMCKTDSETARMELRSPDAACNPYLVFALVLEAGLDGVSKGLTPPEEYRGGGQCLPATLEEALKLFDCAFVRGVLPEQVVDAYILLKRKELSQIGRGKRKQPENEDKLYFHRI